MVKARNVYLAVFKIGKRLHVIKDDPVDDENRKSEYEFAGSIG
jgi:hypothetical protein